MTVFITTPRKHRLRRSSEHFKDAVEPYLPVYYTDHVPRDVTCESPAPFSLAIDQDSDLYSAVHTIQSKIIDHS